MFVSPGAIALKTQFFTIYWYGIVLAVAFVVGLFVALKIAKHIYNDKKVCDEIFDSALWALLGGILGARLYYVLLSLPYYISNPNEIFFIQQGGLSIHGAIIGGLIGGGIFCKIKKADFLKYADIYALGLPIAQAIGRWGNFFNSEAFGKPTALPWGLYIPAQNRPLEFQFYDFFHPTFLYESLWNLFVFLILYFVLRKICFRYKGALFFAYLILYSFGRILIENVRIDSVLNIAGIPVAIWISLVTIIISVISLFIILKNKN